MILGSYFLYVQETADATVLDQTCRLLPDEAQGDGDGTYTTPTKAPAEKSKGASPIEVRIIEPRCTQCGYLLWGLRAPSCPECGYDVTKVAGVLPDM